MIHNSQFTIHNSSLKKIVILGLARQGVALARFFAQAGKEVVVSDQATEVMLQAEIDALKGLPVTFVLGSHPLTLLDECNLLCLSGGVPLQIPLIQEAIRRGIPLSNDSLLTLQQAKLQGLGPLIGITGSSGKTTTTTLVGKILTEAGYSVHVGGNIGIPLIDKLADMEPGEPIILELSSFQLELFDPQISWGPFDEIGPDVAVIVNVTPNHLDRHPTMANYTAAKLNLLKSLPSDGQVVLSVDDGVTSRIAGTHVDGLTEALPSEWQLEALLDKVNLQLADRNLPILPFSRTKQLTEGAWLASDTLLYNGEPICQRKQLRLRGEHNISNLLAAAVISGAVGATCETMGQVARTFAGVPHRLEVVSQKEGVSWINDSIATSPERAVAGLRSFDGAVQQLIVLAGGQDKNLSWDLLADEAIQRADSLIGFGDAGPMIVELVKERSHQLGKKIPNLAVVHPLAEAIKLAEQRAKASGNNKESVVLLSPGGTSFDAYKNFEERGEHFRQLVEGL